MAKDVKRVWHRPCWLLEPEGLEQKFARMAAQGWLLERCTYWTCTYRRGEPGEYEYRVQYIYESRDGQRSDYVKMLGEMGIEKAGDIGSFLVMKKRADGTPFELYSDLDAQIRDTRNSFHNTRKASRNSISPRESARMMVTEDWLPALPPVSISMGIKAVRIIHFPKASS